MALISQAVAFKPDFSVFYDAARGLLMHQNIYALPMYTGLGYPPFTLLPFIPFTFLSYPIAQYIWTVISVVLVFVAVWLSIPKPTVRQFIIISFFTLVAFPTKFTLGMGQVNFLALVLLLLAIRYRSGVLLGFLCIIKPHFLLFLPLFGVRTIMTAVVTLASGALITGFMFGWNQYMRYIHSLGQLFVFSGRGIYYNQGLGAFLSRLLPNERAGDLTLWISVLLIACYILLIVRNKISGYRAIVVFIPVFLLIEPLSWQHHYVFLIPVFVWIAIGIKRILPWVLFGLSYVLISINFRTPPVWAMSHVFLGNVLLLSLVVYETVKHPAAS